MRFLMWWLLFPSFGQLAPAKTKITVGIAAVQDTQQSNIGWARCGGAIPMAIDYLRSKGLLKDVEFEFFVNFTECDPINTVGVGVDFMRDKKVDVVVGPPCPQALRVMGALSTYYDISLLGWGYVTKTDFSSYDKYPYLTTVIANSLSLGYATATLMTKYKWDRASILYIDNELNYCGGIIDDVETALSDEKTISATIPFKGEVIRGNAAIYTDALNKIKATSRIVILCLELWEDRREFLWRAAEAGMTGDEYVFLMLSLRSTGFGQSASSVAMLSTGMTPFWVDTKNGNADKKDGVAENAAKRVIVIDLNNDVEDASYLARFKDEVVERVLGDPFFCHTPGCLNNTEKAMGGYSRHLHDVFYLYGMALDDVLREDPINGANNATKISLAVQRTFQGLTGEVRINSNGTRDPRFSVYALTRSLDQELYLNMTYTTGNAVTIDIEFSSDSIGIWATRGGKMPLATPICGFLGRSCPKTFWDRYLVYVIVASTVALLVIIAAFIFLFYLLRAKKLEQQRLNAEWQVAFTRLRKPPSRREKDRQSKRSLQSGPSTITIDSKFTFDREFSNYSVYLLEKEMVLTTKHAPCTLTPQNYEEFVKLRKLDHDNLNKFVGLSMDGVDYITVWRYCSRSSLKDIIARGKLSVDPFFIFCIVRDLAEGLSFLHNSFVGHHGSLRSDCCLVNDGWQVKISGYGIRVLPEQANTSKTRLLWVAPEHLRDGSFEGSKAGDVYSFAVIASEVISRRAAWNMTERKESLDELLYLVKKGGHNPPRPEINPDGLDISSALLHLVRDCWSESADSRPPMATVGNLLRAMMPDKKANLFDHMFNMMEEYTTTLELEVEERTKELSAEKKKADVLLGRMLPKQVADRLKLGQTVEPEGFDSVSVFFSDVVKFTQLSQKCSPFQVVSLLNELYSSFDAIIEEHDAYKVESIGDGYLCVSGLPIRNGVQHIRQIVEMSLSFMEYVKAFRIPHLPGERVELRIGINSGPCVAGVVGLSMPRYCLFGDTVNTASRMESNGKASHIHVSGDSHNLLTNQFPGEYATYSRGDVIIKGKGVMETFWVIGRSGDTPIQQETTNQRRASSPLTPRRINDPSPPPVVSSPPRRTQNSPLLSLPRSASPEANEEAMYRDFKRRETNIVLD